MGRDDIAAEVRDVRDINFISEQKQTITFELLCSTYKPCK